MTEFCMRTKFLNKYNFWGDNVPLLPPPLPQSLRKEICLSHKTMFFKCYIYMNLMGYTIRWLSFPSLWENVGPSESWETTFSPKSSTLPSWPYTRLTRMNKTKNMLYKLVHPLYYTQTEWIQEWEPHKHRTFFIISSTPNKTFSANIRPSGFSSLPVELNKTQRFLREKSTKPNLQKSRIKYIYA